MKETNNELKNTTYEIFMGLLSVLSIVNLVLLYVIKSDEISMVVGIMDAVLTLIFMTDFLFRLFTADSKMTYFLKQFGWADLLASMPFPQLKILRLFRVIRVWRLLNELGPKGIVDEFVSNRARSALLTLLLFVILLIEFGSLAILSVERYNPDAPIQTASDAVWYTFVTDHHCRVRGHVSRHATRTHDRHCHYGRRRRSFRYVDRLSFTPVLRIDEHRRG